MWEYLFTKSGINVMKKINLTLILLFLLALPVQAEMIYRLSKAGGSNKEIQYNNNGSFGGFGSWDGTTMTVPGDLTSDSFTINSKTLDTNEWAYLDGLDQSLATTSDVTFNSITGDGSNITNLAVFQSSGGVINIDTAVANYADDFVIGSPQLDDDGDTDHDYRLIYDKSKGFFGVGRATGSQWNDANRGIGAIVMGDDSIASGYYAHAEGRQTTASGNYSHAQNETTTASGEASTAQGYLSEASALYSHAEGFGGKSYLYASHAHAGGTGSWGNVYAQYQRVILIADTTDATPEVMYISDQDTYKLYIPAETAWRIDGVVIATTSNCGLSSSWTIKGVIHRDNANNTELIWNSVSEDVDEIVTDAPVTLTADDTNEAFEINITGKAATNIRWVATVNLTEVEY